MSEIPARVRDHVAWLELKELDEHGVHLTQWEIDFVENLMQQLLRGRELTKPQAARLAEIREERL